MARVIPALTFSDIHSTFQHVLVLLDATPTPVEARVDLGASFGALKEAVARQVGVPEDGFWLELVGGGSRPRALPDPSSPMKPTAEERRMAVGAWGIETGSLLHLRLRGCGGAAAAAAGPATGHSDQG